MQFLMQCMNVAYLHNVLIIRHYAIVLRLSCWQLCDNNHHSLFARFGWQQLSISMAGFQTSQHTFWPWKQTGWRRNLFTVTSQCVSCDIAVLYRQPQTRRRSCLVAVRHSGVQCRPLPKPLTLRYAIFQSATITNSLPPDTSGLKSGLSLLVSGDGTVGACTFGLGRAT